MQTKSNNKIASIGSRCRTLIFTASFGFAGLQQLVQVADPEQVVEDHEGQQASVLHQEILNVDLHPGLKEYCLL